MNLQNLLLICMGVVNTIAYSSPLNLTLVLSTDDCIGADNSTSTDAISLTTSDSPLRYTCVNIKDLFTSNSSSNTTSSSLPRLNWSTTGAFDQSANYSHLWYYQVNSSQIEVGRAARRRVAFFPGLDCMQVIDAHDKESPIDEHTVSCQSEGECHVVEYNIQSIGITSPAQFFDEECVVFRSLINLAGRTGIDMSFMTVMALMVVFSLL